MHIFWRYVFHGCISHRASLRVVIGTFRVQVNQIFCCIFSDTKISNSYPRFSVEFLTHLISSVCILVFVCILIFARPKVRIVFFGRIGLSSLGDLSDRRQISRRLVVNFLLPDFLPRRFNCRVFVVDPLVFGWVVSIPPISLCIESNGPLLCDVVCLNVFIRVLGSLFSRPL